ncbi:hypothetical protein H0H93_005087 [Arthromyces matolae]|nr:hypothetical protein H0H93_005087 [Arthromyces matolae]
MAAVETTPTARKARAPTKEAHASVAAAAKKAGKKVSGGRNTRRGDRNNTDENQHPSPPATASDQPHNASAALNNETAQPLHDVGNADDDVAAMRVVLLAELAAMRAHNERLEKELDLAKKSGTTDGNVDTNAKDKPSIPRPDGVAGRDFSIQKAMGLAGSKKKEEKYQSILRWVRELTLQSRINWEVPWAKIPPEEKGKLFKVCRTKNPILERYPNDWATEELVKQYIRNKRHYGYKNGFLQRPDGYDHLKINASKRTNAPRGRKAGGIEFDSVNALMRALAPGLFQSTVLAVRTSSQSARARYNCDLYESIAHTPVL